jgi:DNA-binding NtrC family response regulator
MSDNTRLEGKRILIVDDEPDVIESLKALLSMCVILEATSFNEAKGLLETESLELTILDIMGVDGFKLLEIANKRQIPAVMFTAHSLNPAGAAKSFMQGAASYIPKEEMRNITTYLNDILEAQEQGKHFWWRWLERLDSYFEKRFGVDWKKDDKDIWTKLKYDI